jgi:hypothetical protein
MRQYNVMRNFCGKVLVVRILLICEAGISDHCCRSEEECLELASIEFWVSMSPVKLKFCELQNSMFHKIICIYSGCGLLGGDTLQR